MLLEADTNFEDKGYINAAANLTAFVYTVAEVGGGVDWDPGGPGWDPGGGPLPINS